MRNVYITLNDGSRSAKGREIFDVSLLKSARWEGGAFVIIAKNGSGVSFPAHRVHRVDIDKEEPSDNQGTEQLRK